MAALTLTPIRLTPGTPMADIADALANVVVQVTSSDTLDLLCGGDLRGLQIIINDSGGSAGLWTFAAGVYPPAMHKFKGALNIQTVASDILPIVLERDRHVKQDGSIRITTTQTGKLTAFYQPIGYG